MLPDVDFTKLFIVSGGDGERQPDQNSNSDQQDNQDTDTDQDQGSQNSGQSDNSDSGDSGDSGDDSGGSGKSSDKSAEDQLEELKRENLKLSKQINKANEDKKKSQADKDAARERDEAVAERDSLREVLNGKFLEWSVQTFQDGKTKYDWVDLEDVVKAIDPEAIDIDLKTGRVKGLDLELKRIAKRKPHWLKKDDVDDDDEDKQGSSGQGGIGRGTKIKSDKAEIERIGKKFKIPGYGSQNLRAL